MEEKRITILTGHYGSGKTSLAVAIAIEKQRAGKRVAVADMDIVNPYFRTNDCRELLEEHGIELVVSEFAGSNVDLPSLPAALYGVLEDKSRDVVLDIGGDDRGALAIGRFVPSIEAGGGYAQLFVVNFFRPLTRDAESALEVLHEVETACGLKATAFINNSNLGRLTTPEDIIASVGEAERFCALTGLPLYATAVDRRHYDALKDRVDNLLPIEPQSMPIQDVIA